MPRGVVLGGVTPLEKLSCKKSQRGTNVKIYPPRFFKKFKRKPQRGTKGNFGTSPKISIKFDEFTQPPPSKFENFLS
jgi:hypothetical protein